MGAPTILGGVPAVVVLLVVGAALCHSVWNLALKTETRRLQVALAAMTASVLLATPVLAIYRVRDVDATGWLLVLASAAFETAYFLSLSKAYELGDLSLVYPVARGTAPLVVTPIAIVALGERPSAQGLVGVALVVLGIWGSHASGLGGARSSPRGRRALGFAVLTGLMTAGYSLVNKLGVAAVPVPLYAFLVMLVNTALVWLVVLRRHGAIQPADLRGRWARAALIGVLLMATYVAILVAMSLAPVTYVVAAREVSIVLGALLGAFVLKERHPGARIAGAAVIFAGVVVLALSR